MHICLSLLLRISGIIALLCCSANLAQANTGHEGWYQVEVIVFARRNPSTEEHWPNAIKLRYPARWVELKDPNKPAVTMSQPENMASSSSASSIDFTTEPFWQLPAEERHLNEQARILDRNPNYQLLFHQAWRQQISGARQASSIVINGGKTYGKHQELEGSITLSVATYLKVTTNLWFSQFDLNVETLQPENQQNTWPEIPLRPNYVVATNPATLDGNGDLAPAANLNEVIEEEKDAYKPRQIVLMQQERDMRSNEIHYLDHPLLGVIIRINPYRP